MALVKDPKEVGFAHPLPNGWTAGMAQAQVEEFLKTGSERFLRRSLHRGEHLDKIEKVLRG